MPKLSWSQRGVRRASPELKVGLLVTNCRSQLTSKVSSDSDSEQEQNNQKTSTGKKKVRLLTTSRKWKLIAISGWVAKGDDRWWDLGCVHQILSPARNSGICGGLDRVRAAEDFRDDALPLLINALQQGTSVFSLEEQRRIVTAGMEKEKKSTWERNFDTLFLRATSESVNS